MKKLQKMITLLLAASLVFSLSACGSGASTDSNDTSNISENDSALPSPAAGSRD